MSTADSCPRCGAKLPAPMATDWTCPWCGFDPASALEQAGADSDQGEAAAIQQVRKVEGKSEKERLPLPGRLLNKIAVCAAVLGLSIAVLGYLYGFLVVFFGGSGDYATDALCPGTLVFLLGLAGIITSRLGLLLVRRGLSDGLTPVLILLWPAVLLTLLVAASWIPLRPLNGPHLQMKYLAGQRNFKGVQLHYYNLNRIYLRGADLSEADLSTAHLYRVNLHGADLSGANLQWADLTGTDLTGADLSGADLGWATLTGANVTPAQLTPVKSLKGATLPDGSVHE